MRVAAPRQHKPTVVLIHGWGSDGTVWDAQAAGLQHAGLGTVQIDLRGHGRSLMGGDALTLDRLATDLAIVLATLDLSSVILVGHSGGGYVALRHLENDDIDHNSVRGVCLVSSAAHGQGVAPPERWLMGSTILSRIVKHSGLGVRVLRHTLGPDVDVATVEEVRRRFSATDRHVRGATFAMATKLDLRSVASTLPMPVVVVAGDEDSVIKSSFGEELAAGCPDGAFVLAAGHGHVLPLEAPAVVLDAILDVASREHGIVPFIPTHPKARR